MRFIGRKSLRITTALVVAVLLLRALIPAGFMPMPGAGNPLGLALCPDVADAATFIAASIDPHLHHRQHGDSRSTPCPFALGGTALPTSAVAIQLTAVAFVEAREFARPAPAFLPAVIRVHMPRGPPPSV